MKEITVTGFLFSFNVNVKVLYLPMSPKCKAFDTLMAAGPGNAGKKKNKPIHFHYA